jgi:hypothetical protein
VIIKVRSTNNSLDKNDEFYAIESYIVMRSYQIERYQECIKQKSGKSKRVRELTYVRELIISRNKERKYQ